MQGFLDLSTTPMSPAERRTTTTGSVISLSGSRKFFFLDKDQNEIRFSASQQNTVKDDNKDCERWFLHEIKSVQMMMEQGNGRTLRLVVRNQYMYLTAPTEALASQWADALMTHIESLSPNTSPHKKDDYEKKKKRGGIEQSPFWHFLPLFFMCIHLICAPYTKVEESFNTHAVHDLVTYPSGLFAGDGVRNHFDHVLFPGVVPRTFWGASIVALITYPCLQFVPAGYLQLLLVRFMLGFLGWWTFVRFNSAASRRFLLLRLHPALLPAVYACQFHFCFYSTRFLPNVFAMMACHMAWAELLDNSISSSVAWFVMTATIFRCDVLALLGPVAFWIWFVDTRSRSIHSSSLQPTALIELLYSGVTLAIWGMICFIVSLFATVMLDSHFWAVHRSVLPGFPSWFRWPEGEVLWYNVVENKSSNWGTSPWHWYFTNALPKMLLLSFPLGLVGFVRSSLSSSGDREEILVQRRVFVPTLIFVMLYSFLPHKEVRFLFPSLPIFNLMGSIGLAEGMRMAGKYIPSWLVHVMKNGALLLCMAISLGFLYVSSHNYPAGEAVSWLDQKLEAGGKTVHVDAYSCMNGVSLFLYDKSSRNGAQWFKSPETLGGKSVLVDESMSWESMNDYDYLLWETRDEWITPSNFNYEKLQCFKGEPSLRWIPPSLPRVETRNVICVWKKR